MTDELPRPAFYPPLLYLGLILAGWGLNHVVPLPIGHTPWLRALGLKIIVGAVGLGVWAIATFHRAGTTHHPMRDASAIVTRGPYRFTRNPMYLALSIATLGAGLALNSWWLVILLPIGMALMTVYVIQREERRLEAHFGDSYRAYLARVRRWL